MDIEKQILEATENIQKKIKEIEVEYTKKFKSVEKQAEDDSEDIEETMDGSVAAKFKVDIWWSEVKTILHLPQFTYDPKFVIIDVPGVKMELKSFDIPEIKTEWVDVVTAHIPDCKIRGFSVTCRMKPVIVSQPRVTTRMKPVYFDFPTIFREKWKFDIPWIETKFSETELIYSVPQIAFRDVEAEVKDKTSKLNSKINSSVTQYEAEMKSKIKEVILEESKNIFDPTQDFLLTEREKVRKEFESGISKLKTTIKSLSDQKAPNTQIDPIASQLNDLIDQSKLALKNFDEALQKLSDSKTKFMSSFA